MSAALLSAKVESPKILVGVIGRPHGVRGLVHVHSYMSLPESLSSYQPIIDELGQEWILSWKKKGVASLAAFDNGRSITDREQAEQLTNRRLYVLRSQLPPPEEEEFYISDLIGKKVLICNLEEKDDRVGIIHSVMDYGAGASLEIKGAGGEDYIVPFMKKFVPDVNLSADYMRVFLPDEVEVTDTSSSSSNEEAQDDPL
ncbi:ribosome maturation factor RimM [Entomobacter blattae]|uniref:Ribosome maturation factor RimM n=1 Tax=Entomobacter blattae TaxID=2762277 RepID=A0A7H1NSS7_9PROT|nr:ribosome maturation factor RimM [Entomobacter blattae]QNT78837.1 Ribosome maturation factor RimM [Entomobacter blattae]